MSVSLRAVKWSLALFLTGCGADASVVVQLVSLTEENPYADVAAIEVTASVNERVITRERVAFDGQPVVLDPLESRDNMVLRANGYDGTGAPLSRGLARPEIPDGSDTCCVLMCFCTLPVFDAGDCSCGSDTCVAECFE